MAWTDLSDAFSFGAVLTSTQMQNLRDNLTAIFNANSGAPQLRAGYIGRNKIDYTVSSSGVRHLAPGGTWTPARGFYNCVTIVSSDADHEGIMLQLYVSAGWRSSQLSGAIFVQSGQTRFYNNSVANSGSIYFQWFGQ